MKERLESYRGGSDDGHGRDGARGLVTSRSIQVPAPPFDRIVATVTLT